MSKVIPKVKVTKPTYRLVSGNNNRITYRFRFTEFRIENQHILQYGKPPKLSSFTFHSTIFNRHFHLFGTPQKHQPLQEVDFVDTQNVKVGMKGTENPNNYLIFVQVDGHSIAEDILALQKMFGKPSTTPPATSDTTKTQEHHEQSGKPHTLWIPFYGTIHYQSLNIKDQTFHRLGFEFDKHKTKNADKLFDPSVDGNTKAATAIRLLVDVTSKLPFAGPISERITKVVLSKANLKL